MTERDISIVVAICTYYTLTRAQIQSLCFEDNKKNVDRMARKRLSLLVRAGLIARTHMQVVQPLGGAAAGIYYPTRKGAELAAAHTGDETFLNACVLTPNWQHLAHWTQVAQIHICLRQALALQDDVRLERWVGEWDTVNASEKELHKRYRLYTLLREKPRLVNSPDAAFLLSYKGYHKVYYVELDRGTSGIQQIAHSKTPGYAELANTNGHVKHFPEANLGFSVLNVVLTPGRIQLLQKAIKPKDGSHLWKFLSWDNLQPQQLLHEPIIQDIDGNSRPLVRKLEGGQS